MFLFLLSSKASFGLGVSGFPVLSKFFFLILLWSSLVAVHPFGNLLGESTAYRLAVMSVLGSGLYHQSRIATSVFLQAGNFCALAVPKRRGGLMVVRAKQIHR